MLTFLLVLQALIGAVLVAVILMQQSEGGGLGMGGSPSGLMSARGAADFMTRATAVLATVFVGLSILQAVLATRQAAPTIDTSLARPATPAPATAPAVPVDPAVGGAAPSAVPQGAAVPVPAPTPVPIATERAAPPAPRPAPARETTTTRTETQRASERPARASEAPTARPATPAPTTPAAPAPTVPIGGGSAGNSN